MQQHSVRYIILFAAAVCVVCSIFVAGAAVGLRDLQERNRILDQQTKVLGVAGLMSEDETITADEVQRRFDEFIQPVVVNLKTGKATEIDPSTFDQRVAAADPQRSTRPPPNAAKVQRIPNEGLVYQVVREGQLEAFIIPIEGKGLWSTMYGYLALDDDTRTINGITFYQHGETPGLGGEIDNPSWKALWKGRKAFDESWEPKIALKKGQAGPPEKDPFQVDGLSGATLTARGVTASVQFWLGEHGFGPYLTNYRQEKGIQ